MKNERFRNLFRGGYILASKNDSTHLLWLSLSENAFIYLPENLVRKFI